MFQPQKQEVMITVIIVLYVCIYRYLGEGFR